LLLLKMQTTLEQEPQGGSQRYPEHQQRPSRNLPKAGNMGLGRICFCCCIAPASLVAVIGAVLAGFYQKELEQFRQLDPSARWVNWIGEFSCGPGVVIERPTTVEEVQAAVRRYPSVRAAATGHSFNTFHCPQGEKGAVIDVRAFNTVQIVRRGDGYAAVAGTGIKMGQLQNEILARGLTLRVPPGNPAYTLGGCIATGCHNLGQSHAQDLLALTIVMHNGTVREVDRSDPDFSAAAVSIGRMGIILSVTMEVLPYRSLQWRAEQLDMPNTTGIIEILGEMKKRFTSRETVGNKLVFYLATGVMMMEHWIPLGRESEVEESPEPLPPYINPQPFRVGQGVLSETFSKARDVVYSLIPIPLLNKMQVPAELAFRKLHSSPMLAKVRKAMGWQHTPEGRGEASNRPSGIQYTWAGWLDEVTNLIMGLRHIEVIFPLEPRDQAEKCLDIVFAHQHLTWWRLNIRTMLSENYLMSSTYNPPDMEPVTFLRVDFVAPGSLLALPSGEESLTSKLHTGCPGWRKHWGKGLFTTSSEERWGDAPAFLEAVSRWDPEGKFRPLKTPTWLKGV